MTSTDDQGSGPREAEATERPRQGSEETQVPKAPPPSPPPPRGPSGRLVGGIAILALVMLWVGVQWGEPLRRVITEAWQSVSGPGDGSRENGKARFYTCGMHPWVILPAPGDCPVCHMQLTPLDPEKFTGQVVVDPVVLQNIGVRIDRVEKGPVVRSIRTVGTVDYDETTVRDVNIKISGWIEKLHVDYVGAEVEKRQPLFELYSRELYEAQEEYLLAYRGRESPAVEFVPRASKDARDLAESSRIRLELYDISPQQIEELERSGKPARTMTIVSPHRGVVTDKHANEGMQVEPGMRVYQIADLSRVWVLVTLWEFQLPFVSEGQRAVMRLPYIPGQTFEGKVTYIYPWLNKKIREVKVRLEFDNPDLLLKPGMYANVELRGNLADDRTLAPRSSVIDTGERKVAFVSLGDGRFEPREVVTGVETDGGRVEIIDGLYPGEMVVTSGQFLIDSESKLREALAKMVRGDLASEQRARAAVAGKSELTSLPETMAARLVEILEAYFAIGNTLAGDTAEGIGSHAQSVASGVGAILKEEVPGDPHFWHRHTEVATVGGKARELAGESDLARARVQFADLSVALAKLVRATGVPSTLREPVEELRCPMYRVGQGGSTWLQLEGEVRNPYFGSSMLRCFDQRTALPPTGLEPLEKPEERQQAEDAAPAEHTEHTPAPRDPPREERPRGEEKAREDGAADRQAAVDRLVRGYLDVQQFLATDGEGVPGGLQEVREAATLLGEKGTGVERARAGEILKSLAVSKEAGIGRLRAAFKDLSRAVIALVEKTPPSVRVAPQVFRAHCPMAKASWLQTSRQVSNPYYGSSMLRCGEITATISAGSAVEE